MKPKLSAKTCPHGRLIEGEISEAADLGSFSFCDCCGDLMHHNSIGFGYFAMKDGRTLCCSCVVTENPKNIDQ